MNNFRKFSVILLAAGLVLGLAGCPQNPSEDDVDMEQFDRYFAPTYRSNNQGSVEVINPTSHDMLLFRRGQLINNNIVGGVRRGDTAKVNFSDRTDYVVGGFEILTAVKLSEYINAREGSNTDYTAMVTYRNGAEFRITLQSRADGNYRFTVFNRNRDFPMEIRKNTPIGEKIAFAAPGEGFYRVRTTTSEEFIAYPVWVAYNHVSKSIVSFCPADDPLSVQPVQPVLLEHDNVPMYFPSGGTSTITFDVDIPFATVQVRNNFFQSVVFRSANAMLTPQSGYRLIRSGIMETYEVRSEGFGMDINIAAGPMQDYKIPVRFQDNPSVTPVLENGWIYTVELNFTTGGDMTNPDDYTAWLVKSSKINQNDFLTAF